MKYFSKKLGLVIASLTLALSASAANACCNQMQDPYRTYYLDRSGYIYYIDMYGDKVVEGKYGYAEFNGLTLQKCGHRWFYQDQLGNRFYVVKPCKYWGWKCCHHKRHHRHHCR